MVFGDSALIINQVNNDWDCTSERMDAYYAQIRKLENKFYGLEFHHVVQAHNEAADKLSKLGSTQAEIPHGVFIQDLVKSSIEEEEKSIAKQPSADQLVTTVSTTGTDWREPFIRYFTSVEVPQDKTEMERLIRRSKHYVLVEGKLMRKNMNEELLQKYVFHEQDVKILEEIHVDTCGNHAASRTLVGKVFWTGFYWPSAVVDAEKHCEGCQFFAKQTHVLAYELQTIPASWPFVCWGLVMIGPFKPAPGGFCWVYVIINKFSKCTKYRSLVLGTTKKAAELLDEIIYRFGLPNNIITDLGSSSPVTISGTSAMTEA
jgi:predicted SnoaL-like aldol condensation-catalyzing enzyme